MENYKKKYEEAMLRMNKWVEGSEIIDPKEVAEFIFPELKEPEDERIRKDLINYFGEHKPLEHKEKEVVAWLEKQGEQKSIDKVESKFKTGDWVVNKQDEIARINQVKKDSYGTLRYYIEFTNGVKTDPMPCFADEVFHLWTLQEAKDGDVLLFEGNYNSIVLFQGIGINGKERINYHCKCDLGNYSFGIQGDVAHLGTVDKDAEHYHPATKEQCNILFQKMKEAGYEWDAEKKELKKIEQKSAWSEEDEDALDIAIRIIRNGGDDCAGILDSNKVLDWLKSLKERMKGE